MQTIVQTINDAYEAAIPSVVLVAYTKGYEPDHAGLRAGLRGENGWLVEPEPCDLLHARAIQRKYGRDAVSYLVNDSSADWVEFNTAVLEAL